MSLNDSWYVEIHKTFAYSDESLAWQSKPMPHAEADSLLKQLDAAGHQMSCIALYREGCQHKQPSPR